VRFCDLVVWGKREASGTRYGRVGDFGPWDVRSTIASNPDALTSGCLVRAGIPFRYIAARQIAAVVCDTVRP